ncbi:MAG: phytoene desaturase [Cyclobacteriaceae bacterium]|nr:phytoene desaturase [Cyclobacteriaceae bacterium HetDA_MAG_MS6]
MSSNKNVAIIGSGIAGIATAIRLAAKGHQVTVYESNTYPGGKLTEIKLGRYRFDAGPSLFTLPSLVDELFELAGENPREHFSYAKLPINCHYFYEDGTRIQAYSENEKFTREIAEKTNEPIRNVQKALKNSETLYAFLSDQFMFRSLHDPRTFLTKKAIWSYFNLHRMDFFRSMNRANESFFKDKRVVQLFNRYATYNGSNPYQTPATMNIIPHLEFGYGAFFPDKGMHHITESLINLAGRLGVSFLYNHHVQKINITDGEATGLVVNNKSVDYDRVVCNMDMVSAYKHLLKDQKQPKKLLQQPKSSSALIFYWGVKRSFNQLDLHNIFFSQDYQKEFDCIFNKGGISNDPTVYINITSKLKKDDAPSGCENWFTMINTPNNQGQDWDTLVGVARKNIQQKLSRLLGTDIQSLIEEEDILDARTIESRTSSSLGALYGNSSNNKFAAFLRHPNFSKNIKQLYFCGGSVHPGGGIPMCLSSAKIVDRYFK